MAPKAEELAAKAVRNAILHRKLAKYGPRWGAWLVRDVGFPDAKLMISCFHKKLHRQVLVSDHWHQKLGSWAPECKKYCVLFLSFEGASGPNGLILDSMGVPRSNGSSE